MAVNWKLKNVPMGTVGSEGVVTCNAGAATVMVTAFWSVRDAESVTFTVTGNDPVAVGTPERTPVAGFRVSPPGSVPDAIDQV